MVEAQGMSHEEAETVCKVEVSTVKSRVNQARSRGAGLLGLTDGAKLGPDGAAKATLAAE